MDIDDVYRKIGEFGPSQKKIVYPLFVYYALSGFPVLLLAFIGVAPEWSCRDALEEGEDRCSAFDKGHCTPVYTSEYGTIVTEWDLICSRSSLPSFTQSLFFLGAVVGSGVFGTLADRIGRKRTFFIAMILTIFAQLGCYIAPSYHFFATCRFLVGMFTQGQVLSAYVLTLELLGPSKRTVVGLTLMGVFAFSFPILAVLAYYITEWRTLYLACTLIVLPFCFLWWVVPGSPRWMMVTGRVEQAKAVLAKLARGNGVEVALGELKVQPSAETSTVSTLDLFRGKEIRFRTLVMLVVWFTNCLAYYALSLAAGDLGGDRYISFSLSGLVELPSIMLSYYTLGRFGRKWSHAVFLLLSGCACLLWTFLNAVGGAESLKMGVALTGKFAVAGSFAIVYLYAAEVFPTEVRNIAMGVVTMGARAGGILAPLVLLLGQYSSGLPMFLIGAGAVGTGILSFSLPETLGQPMPETLAELETTQ